MQTIAPFTPTPLLAPAQSLDYDPYRCVVCSTQQNIIYPGADQLCPRCAEATKRISFEEMRQLVADYPDMELLELLDDLRMSQATLDAAQAIIDAADFDAQAAQRRAERIEARIALLRTTARLCAAEWN